VVTGGSRHALGGTFFAPTVLAGASTAMKLAQEETFGPVAAVFRFESEEEVIRLANDTPFGLAAYFYTRDLARAFRVADEIEAGMVGINAAILGNEIAPFGGVKESGLGREGGHHGIEEYLEMKYLLVGGL
jgi:succinate-semialdehyde dehydrogenase/glutarate-semialdehyde dehydrogenase